MEVALVYFAVIAIAFFVLIVRPQRRRLAAHRAFVASIEVGDEVVTTGGVFGTVRRLDDDRVDLEVAPGVVIGVARAAIAQSATSTAVGSGSETTRDAPVEESSPADEREGDD
jgi:preprotein translocase subunit YajC